MIFRSVLSECGSEDELEFDSVDAARAWYESEGDQNAAKLRQAAADCNVAILSGFGD